MYIDEFVFGHDYLLLMKVCMFWIALLCVEDGTLARHHGIEWVVCI